MWQKCIEVYFLRRAVYHFSTDNIYFKIFFLKHNALTFTCGWAPECTQYSTVREFCVNTIKTVFLHNSECSYFSLHRHILDVLTQN
jgi:hypothetical protein